MLAASLLLCSLIVASSARLGPGADAAAWDRSVGEWQARTINPATIVETAIEDATAKMNLFTRGIARGRLEERKRAANVLTMAVTVSSPRLSKSVQYTLAFSRVSATR